MLPRAKNRRFNAIITTLCEAVKTEMEKNMELHAIYNVEDPELKKKYDSFVAELAERLKNFEVDMEVSHEEGRNLSENEKGA